MDMRDDFFQNEIRCGYHVSQEVKKLWAVELDLLERFIRVCEEQGLTYYAMFGTLLGAARHAGFIPWDDDIDIAMPREDYDRLKAMPELFEEPYFLQTPENDPSACPRYIKLRHNGTTHIPALWPSSMTKGGHLGIAIDIIPLDIVPSSRAAERLAKAATGCQELRHLRAAIDENGWENTPEWKRERCRKVENVSYDELTARYHDICTRHSGVKRPGRYYAMPILEGDHVGLCVERNDFAEPTYMDFEHLKIAVPSGYEKLLSEIYGDCMGLPDDIDRIPTHEGLISADVPYTEYIKPYTEILTGLEGKRIVTFGAGDSLRIFMRRFGAKFRPECTFDNDQRKWGMLANGVPVRSPAELPGMDDGNTQVIIVSIHHRSIGEQLCNLGICDYRVFIDGWKY